MPAYSFALYDAFCETVFGGSQAAVITDTRGIKHAGPRDLPPLVDALMASGFGDDDILGFLGENFRRVAASAWQPTPQ